MNEKIIEIFTDGASKGNPGKGGYGILMKFNGKEKEISGGYKLTTNNRMELMAVIVALESIKRNDCPVHIYSDSRYVLDSITKGWVYNWVRKPNFADKKNKDLWLRFLKIEKNFNVRYTWVKGHNGHDGNERADLLANTASQSSELKIDVGYEGV